MQKTSLLLTLASAAATTLAATFPLAIGAAAPTVNREQGTVNRGGSDAAPNIILILIDDLGYADIAPFGSTKHRTPNLDRMAAEGIKLTSFYVAPVCTPSRAQLMTGCYAKRVSLGRDVLFPVSATGLNPKEHTIARLLKTQGYSTMCIGKWHLGDQPEFLPTRHGFDAYYGLPYSNDMGGSANNTPAAKPKKAKTTAPPRPPRPPLPLVRNDKPIEIITPEKQDHLVDRYTEAAITFIRQHAPAVARTAKGSAGVPPADEGRPDPRPIQNPKSKIQNPAPFFLYLAHNAVHAPLHPGPKFRGKSANGPYGDWVEEVDSSTGRILDTLRELNLAHNTLVIFTSDNGPRQTQPTDAGSAAPLRGAKGSTYEGGVRVPTLAWWPGAIPAAATTDAITGAIDILPTLAALAAAPLPPGTKIDGVDITPVLLGKTPQSTRRAHYYFGADNAALEAVRVGPWKLAIAPQKERNGAKRPPAATFTPRLYNLETDIAERHDLAAQHPDIVARLQTLAAEMDKDLGKSSADGPGVRPPGHVANPVGLWLPGHPPSKQTLKAHYD